VEAVVSERGTASLTEFGLPKLAALRLRLPDQPATLEKLLEIAADLAGSFRHLSRVTGDRLPTRSLTDQPVVRIKDTGLPVTGFSYWDPAARQWVIALNDDESHALRRFTMFHEFGHIIWHGWEHLLFPGMPPADFEQLAEQAADFFAAEVLMPRANVERLVAEGITDVAALAKQFDVSRSIMRWQLGNLDVLPQVPGPTRATGPFIRPRPPLLVDVIDPNQSAETEGQR